MAKKWLGRKLLSKNKGANETEVSPAEVRAEPKEEEPQVEEEVQHGYEEHETQGEESQRGDTQHRWESFEIRLSERMRKSTLKKDTVGQEKGLEEMVVKNMASRKNPVWSQLMNELGEYYNSTAEVEILPSTMDDISDIPSSISTSSVPFDETGPPMIVSESVPATPPLTIHSMLEAAPIIYSKNNAGPPKIVSVSDSVSIESRAPSADSTLTSTKDDSDDEKSVACTASVTRATQDSESSMNSFERAISRFTSLFLYYIGEDESLPPCSSIRCGRR